MEKFLWALGHRDRLYCLVPGHRMDSDLEYKSSIKEVVGALAFGMVGLHVTGTFTDESFTISKNWLLLGGAITPESARLQASKHQKHMANTFITSFFASTPPYQSKMSFKKTNMRSPQSKSTNSFPLLLPESSV